MQWLVFLIAAAVLSSSDGCSRLCPCRREIENVTQMLHSLGDIEESLVFQVVETLKNISSNMDQLMQDSAENKNMGKALDHLSERVKDMSYEIQDLKGADENCTEEDVPAPTGKGPVLAPPKKGSKECPANWVEFDGSCYYFQQSKVRATQDSANDRCNSHHKGSALVAIETEKEFNFLKKHLNSIYSSMRSKTTNGFLISGKKVSNKWIWATTGASVDFSAMTWATGQPSGQSCLALWPKSSFNVADVYCSSYERQYICEI